MSRTPEAPHATRRFWASFALSALIVFLPAAPLGAWSNYAPWPLAPIWAAYGWGLGRAGVREAIALFVLALLQDLVSGGPFGAWAPGILLAFIITRANANHPLMEGPVGFAFVTGLAGGASGLAMAALQDVAWPPLALSALFTVIIFPFFARYYLSKGAAWGARMNVR